MAKSTTDQKLKQAKRVRRAWKTGTFKTRGHLANHFDLTYNQVRGILTGRVKTGGTVAAPEGNYREYKALGKTVLIYDDGRVWSMVSNRFIGSSIRLGYKIFSLREPVTNNLINFRVSRVMLEVFVRPPIEGEWARHLDDVPANNMLENLAWGFPQDNSDDCYRNGHRQYGEGTNTNKLTDKIVKRLMKEYGGEPYKTFAKDFVDRYKLDVKPLSIVRILRGQLWTHITGFTRAKQGTNAKLDVAAVHSIHRNFKNNDLGVHEFSELFSEHLSKKGYKVLAQTVLSALRGKTWPEVHAEHW